MEWGWKKGEFCIVCPDGETDAALDQVSMNWASDDVVEQRPVFSRWDADWKEASVQWIAEAERRKGGK